MVFCFPPKYEEQSTFLWTSALLSVSGRIEAEKGVSNCRADLPNEKSLSVSGVYGQLIIVRDKNDAS